MNIYGDGIYYKKFEEHSNFSSSISSGYVFYFTFFGCFKKSFPTWWHIDVNYHNNGVYVLKLDNINLYNSYLNLFNN